MRRRVILRTITEEDTSTGEPSDNLLGVLPFGLDWLKATGAMGLVDPTKGRTVNLRIWTCFGPKLGPENGVVGEVAICKSLSSLVGPPGFEPGTSCTPSKRASQAAPRPEPS